MSRFLTKKRDISSTLDLLEFQNVRNRDIFPGIAIVRVREERPLETNTAENNTQLQI